MLSDFGLSRNLSKQKGEDLTEYVVTRFYRAPEIMLSSHEVEVDCNEIVLEGSGRVVCGLLLR